jgi:hypothetical protein
MSNTSLLLLCRSTESQLSQVQSFLTQQDQRWVAYFSPNNPDLHVIDANDEGVQISDVRQLIADLSLRPFQESQSLFVILGADSASLPAQQALLKSLEEPPAHTQILLAVTQPGKLLPTIQSRCVLYKWPAEAGGDLPDLQAAAAFWQELSSKNFGELVLESEKFKEREQALSFVHELLVFLHQQNQRSPNLSFVRAVQICQQTQQYLEQNVAVRLALENCFFALKKLKKT